jgi:hypothetical protein
VNPVEAQMLAYLESRLRGGTLGVAEAEIIKAVIPTDHPEFRFRPSYRHGLERLLRRLVINATDAPNGQRYYFIGHAPSAELRHWLSQLPV